MFHSLYAISFQWNFHRFPPFSASFTADAGSSICRSVDTCCSKSAEQDLAATATVTMSDRVLEIWQEKIVPCRSILLKGLDTLFVSTTQCVHAPCPLSPPPCLLPPPPSPLHPHSLCLHSPVCVCFSLPSFTQFPCVNIAYT